MVAGLRAIGAFLVARSRVLRGALVVGWATWIWFLSSSRLPATVELPFAGVLGNLAHAPLFGLLGLLALAALAPKPEGSPAWPAFRRWHFVLSVGLVVAYALLDELHQSFTPGRSPSIGDVVTDGLGAAAVAATVQRLDPRGANGRGLLRLWGFFLLAIVLSATLADALGFFGLEDTSAASAQ